MTEPGGTARERLLLIIAALLAALAGMVDADRVPASQRTFHLVHERQQHAARASRSARATWLRRRTIAELIALFVLGAAGGQILAGFTGSRHMTWVLVGRGGFARHLAAVLATAPEPMVLAMGALNASMRSRRTCPGQPDFCHRGAGTIRPGFGRSPVRALERVELAGASLTLARADRRGDNRRRSFTPTRGSGNLGSGEPRRRSRGLARC